MSFFQCRCETLLAAILAEHLGYFFLPFFFVLKSVSTQYSAKDISVYARDFSNDRSVIVSVLHTFCFVQTTIFSTGCYQSGNTPVQCVKKKRPPNIQCPVEVKNIRTWQSDTEVQLD